jgi:peptide/nickel transport system substrate-binding protein
VVTLEFRSFVDRLMTRRDFDMAIVPLRSGHTDPMADMNILLSSGPMHLWNPAQAKPATTWEAEIDRLMQEQATATDRPRRKRAFDRVQEILAEHCPLVPLVSPHMLVAARRGIGNFRPSILPNAALWNAEELYWTAPDARR